MTLTTPNLGLPYPELSDTADVPRDVKALAETLDVLLGGGGGGGGTGTLPLSNAPVLQVGQVGQVRAGRELAVADFTSLGLGTPVGLFNLSGLTNLGSGGPLVNLGAVPFGVGINGLAATCAVFAGSTGQALYIADTGAADPFRIRTGSFGCWLRTAKRGTGQYLLSKYAAPGNQRGWAMSVASGNTAQAIITSDGMGNVEGSTLATANGLSDIADDRWHFVVATFDGATLRLFVDGAPEGAASMPAPILAVAAPLNIGAQGADASTAAGGPYYGRVDEAFVTPDVLTEDQVRLLYACRLAHGLGTIPTTARLAIHRRRRGGTYAVADFPAQPIRLHNFTAGALTDQGTGGVGLTPQGGTFVTVAGVDGSMSNALSFTAANLAATDAGLPGGLTARSYGCWFKTTTLANQCLMGWGTSGSADARLFIRSDGLIQTQSGGDTALAGYVADGQWHHAVVVEDNTASDGVRRKLYLDGRLVAGSTVLNSITLAGANRFRVGANPDGTGTAPFTGQIDAAFAAATAYTHTDVEALYGRGVQELGASPKNSGDHVERIDATSVLFIGDTLEPQHTVDLGVAA